MCGWYFGGNSLSFRAYSSVYCFRYFRRSWQGNGMIVQLLIFMLMLILLCGLYVYHYFGGNSLSFRAYSFSLLFQVQWMTAGRRRRDRTLPRLMNMIFRNSDV